VNIKVEFVSIQLLMDLETEGHSLHSYSSQSVLPQYALFQLSRNTLDTHLLFDQGPYCI